jgi:hypothetical protein
MYVIDHFFKIVIPTKTSQFEQLVILSEHSLLLRINAE